MRVSVCARESLRRRLQANHREQRRRSQALRLGDRNLVVDEIRRLLLVLEAIHAEDTVDAIEHAPGEHGQLYVYQVQRASVEPLTPTTAMRTQGATLSHRAAARFDAGLATRSGEAGIAAGV
jgi:hypothetical protein